MEILVTEFRQESNSFSPVPSDLAFWKHNGWVLAPGDVHGAHAGSGSALDGMLDEIGAVAPDARVIFGPAYYAQSGGTATQDVMDLYVDELLEVLAVETALAAIIFSFHGALQTTAFDDAEAEVLRRVREVVGQDVIFAVSTDMHGYISRPFAERADVICGYQTYPHVDFHETGVRAARLALLLLDKSNSNPVQAWAPVPMIVSASAYNSLEGPFADLIDHGHKLVESGDIIDFTVYQMQPWLDVKEPNSAVVVIAEDAKGAQSVAELLAEELYSARHAFRTELSTIDEAIDMAASPESVKPVIVVDSADSNNAGAPGDSMAVAASLLERSSMPRSATVVSDAGAAELAHELGVGGTALFTIGGSMDPHAPQISATGSIRSLHDGVFRPEHVGHTGDLVRVGRAAVVQFGNLDVIVCEHIAGNGDPQLYRAFGIEPKMYDLIVVKANTSFRAGYREIGGTIVLTDTPGAAAADVSELSFERLPPTIYPWVDAAFTPRAEMPRGTR